MLSLTQIQIDVSDENKDDQCWTMDIMCEPKSEYGGDHDRVILELTDNNAADIDKLSLLMLVLTVEQTRELIWALEKMVSIVERANKSFEEVR